MIRTIPRGSTGKRGKIKYRCNTKEREATKVENVGDGEAKEGQNRANQGPNPEVGKRWAKQITEGPAPIAGSKPDGGMVTRVCHMSEQPMGNRG